MRRDTLFELRVLTGTHAGARSLLSGEPQVLGSGDDCDLILSDEGVLAQHARLEHREDGSAVLRWLDGDLPPLVIRPGQGAALGPVHIAVEASDAPWRTDLEVLGVLSGPGVEESASTEAPGAGGLADEPHTQAGALDAPDDLRRRARRRRFVLAASALALAATVLSGWAFQRYRPAAHTPVQAPDSIPAPLAVDPAGEADPARAVQAPGLGSTGVPASPVPPVPKALGEALARLALGDRVHAQPRPGRSPLVQGALLSDEETERLAITLSRLQPRPGLRLVTLADLQAQADAAVQDALTGAPADQLAGARPVRATHVGEGRFRVEGRVADDATRDQLLARLAQAPDLRGLEPAVVTPAEVAASLLADLRAQGIGRVDGQWGDGVLALSVHLGAGELPQWERALVAASARHPLPLRAAVQMTEPPTPPPPVVPVLPFAVRSVVSGDAPFIVLDNAAKVGVGGIAMGWRVAEIRPNAVVFEDPQQRRLVFQR
jgi:type III secretion protein D